MVKNPCTNSSENKLSLWQIDSSFPQFTPLKEDIHVDVCIVGGGIAGLTTAYKLASENRSVAVLEGKVIGHGETARSTSHLSNAFDDRYYRVENLHGLSASMAIAQSHTKAIDWIEKIVIDESIDCGFERLDGYLFVNPEDSKESLEKELKAAHAAGLDSVEWSELPIPALSKCPSLRFPYQAQMNPFKYLIGLAQAVINKGGQIFDHTQVVQVEGGTSCLVKTDSGLHVQANHVVVATNTPINDKIVIHNKQSSHRTYVIGARIPKESVKRALYWDTEEPYHYIRLQSGLNLSQKEEWTNYDILIVGGEDHKTGKNHDSAERYIRLEKWTRERFEIDAVLYRWSGQIQEPVDAISFIGADPFNQNVYVVTGDSGNGMTHGTIAGYLIKDLILKSSHPWSEVYNPARKSCKFESLKRYSKHNMEVAENLTEYLTPGEVDLDDEITPGNGAIMRKGMHKIAVYKDKNGKIYRYSAVCRHLRCIVAWNPAEETWDCPCHGSRYDRYGKVINGPACTNLIPFEE